MFNLPLRVIAKTKLSGAAASVTFTLADYTIPAGTRHLAVIVNARGDRATTNENMNVTFNGDGGANYNAQELNAEGAAAAAGRNTGATSLRAFTCAGASATANVFGGGMFIIPHYAGSANHKALLSIGGTAESFLSMLAGRWANAAAITSITVTTSSSGNYNANSIFLLCAVDERYLVEEQLLAADGTVTFSSIPQLDGDLVALGFVRTDRAAVSDDIDVTVNADTTDANYARQRLSGSNTTTAAAAAADRALIEGVPGDSATANAFGAFVLSISQHANGVKQPHILVVSGYHETSGPTSNVAVASGRRANIAAYTSMLFAPGAGGTNLKSGSLISLYHVPKRLVDYDKLTVDATSVTHTVPAGLEALVESVFARSDEAAATDTMETSFNNDVTDANYDAQILTGDGATVAAAQSAASRASATVPAASATANIFGGGVKLIPAYAETDRHKHSLSIDGAADDIVALRSKRWESLTAITEIDQTLAGGDNFEGD